MENNIIDSNPVEAKMPIKKNMVIIGAILLVAIVAVIIFINANSSDKISVEGCRPGDEFSETTGKPCDPAKMVPCKEGDVYDINTGKPCAK